MAYAHSSAPQRLRSWILAVYSPSLTKPVTLYYPTSSNRANSCPSLFSPSTRPSLYAHRAAAFQNVDLRTGTATSLSLSCLPWNPPRRPNVCAWWLSHLHTLSGSEPERRAKKPLQAPSPDARHRNIQGPESEHC
ncbi:hypothetical protein FIBSPDRAFT_957989 [Athelia psychrophila]|uniref:Uncharacterized protein n=1 Tax=Athelia psychrophila TaxID=1759441 RepID=A0A166F4C5_9AGAM|nr:hypothetical protein FIBSPDRAFT_957989 [Fibularhizoctonia sp. CBS 109695]